MSTKINKSLIINQIISSYNFKNDKEFADFLEIKPQTLSSWRSRNTIDYDLIFAKCVDIDMNFVFTGEGSIRKDIPLDRKDIPFDKFYKQNQVAEEQPLYNSKSDLTKPLKDEITSLIQKIADKDLFIQDLRYTVQLQKEIIDPGRNVFQSQSMAQKQG